MNALPKQDQQAEELIAEMAAQGFTITRSELARWHRADLIARPQRRSQGRGRGMASIYPAETAEQLRALCVIHHSEKRLTYVAWRLWWAGYDVPTRYARFFLDQGFNTWQQGLRELQELQAHPEMLTGFFAHTQVMRLSRKTLAQARKRVGRKNFPTFIGIIFRIATGTFEGFAIDAQTGTDERESSILESGFGLRRARTDRLGDAEPWLTDDASEALKELSHRLRDHPLGEDYRTLEDADLLHVRDEVRDFLSCIEGVSTWLDKMFGRGALGFSAFADAIREMDPFDQALMLLFWRMFRAWGLGPAMDQLLRVARAWHQFLMPLINGIEQLRIEAPATAEVLAPKQMGIALRRKAMMAYQRDILRYLSQKPEVKAFFESHPELSLLVDAYEKQQQNNGDGGDSAE
jgi:hypothetical protein